MSITNFDPKLQAIIQSGHLELGFKEALESTAAYRQTVERKSYAIRIGQTTTDTRMGLYAPNDAPLSPSSRVGLDDGLTAMTATVEQWTMGIDRYASTIDIDSVDSQVGIADQYVATVSRLGKHAAQSLERRARNVYLSTYGAGRTFVSTTLGSAGANVAVDDVRGFEVALKNGRFDPVSGSNTASVQVGNNIYTLVNVSRDSTNTSLLKYLGDTSNTAGGVSGVLTFQSNVTVADGTAGKPVVHANAPSSLRAGGRESWKDVLKTDRFSAQQIIDGVTQLRQNTGMVNDTFEIALSPASMSQLFTDPDFKNAYQGQYGSREMKTAQVFELYGVRFVQTSEAPLIKNGNVTVHSPLLIGPEPLVEGRYAGMDSAAGNPSGVSHITDIDGTGCQLITRAALNRLGDRMAVSWQFLGGWAAPTDATTDQSIIPTAAPAYLKRALLLQHGA
jgi:hypothetical protein